MSYGPGNMNELLEAQLRTNCYGSPWCEPDERCECLRYYEENPEEFDEEDRGRWLVWLDETGDRLKADYYPEGKYLASGRDYLHSEPCIWVTQKQWEDFVLKIRGRIEFLQDPSAYKLKVKDSPKRACETAVQSPRD